MSDIALVGSVAEAVGAGTAYVELVYGTTPAIGDTVVIILRYRDASLQVSNITITSEATISDAASGLGTLHQVIGSSFSNSVHHFAVLSKVTVADAKTIRATFSTAPSAGNHRMTVLILSGCNNAEARGAEVLRTQISSERIGGPLTTEEANSAVIAVYQNTSGATQGGGSEEGGYTAFTAAELPDAYFWSNGQYNLHMGVAGSKNVYTDNSDNKTFGFTAMEILAAAAATPALIPLPSLHSFATQRAANY